MKINKCIEEFNKWIWSRITMKICPNWTFDPSWNMNAPWILLFPLWLDCSIFFFILSPSWRILSQELPDSQWYPHNVICTLSMPLATHLQQNEFLIFGTFKWLFYTFFPWDSEALKVIFLQKILDYHIRKNQSSSDWEKSHSDIEMKQIPNQCFIIFLCDYLSKTFPSTRTI